MKKSDQANVPRDKEVKRVARKKPKRESRIEAAFTAVALQYISAAQ